LVWYYTIYGNIPYLPDDVIMLCCREQCHVTAPLLVESPGASHHPASPLSLVAQAMICNDGGNFDFRHVGVRFMQTVVTYNIF